MHKGRLKVTTEGEEQCSHYIVTLPVTNTNSGPPSMPVYALNLPTPDAATAASAATLVVPPISGWLDISGRNHNLNLNLLNQTSNLTNDDFTDLNEIGQQRPLFTTVGGAALFPSGSSHGIKERSVNGKDWPHQPQQQQSARSVTGGVGMERTLLSIPLDTKKSRKPRMLIIDEVTSNRKMMSRMLRWMCDLVDDTGDGAEAYTMMQRSLADPNMTYDVVLCNFTLGHDSLWDGPKLARAFREMGFGGAIIGVAVKILGGDYDLFLQAGADRVMKRPINVGKLEVEFSGELELPIFVTAV